GVGVDEQRLERALGVPVVPGIAREGVGIPELLDAAHEVATGARINQPFRLEEQAPGVEEALAELVPLVERAYPGLPNARWVALRLLNADEAVQEAVVTGELGRLRSSAAGRPLAAAASGSYATAVEPAGPDAAAL